jgi:hypothetical protein
MADQQHIDLLNVLINTRAKAIFISTYPNPLYDLILRPAGWDYVVKDMPNHSAQNKIKQRRQEMLWFRV